MTCVVPDTKAYQSLLIAMQYCLILDDNFATINSTVWSHEVEIGGFG
jgi:hypothetical protein